MLIIALHQYAAPQHNTSRQGGGGPWPTGQILRRVCKKFFLKMQFQLAKNFLLKSKFDPVIKPRMKSFHYEPREIKATEARLRSIYDAAYLGLKGDSLALAAGLMPVEYRQLCQLDPVAELAEKQGRADSEITASRALHNAAQQGDAKAALAILQHRHEWSAKQEISVDIYQKISITQALADATNRVIEHMPAKELSYGE